ncbi:accessory factor UbiK family protein [Thiobacter aerophilum]|uniref:Ubiquinone biosynthesis accessory factor UbiK n=1 Tax=Thiobacter aerophilum TaxID=3121275 RepID=A0ABV0ED27_9BURK
MLSAKFLDELSVRIREVFSQSPAADVEKNLRALLTSVFTRLDLVTREEFEAQQAVLARTREKLEALERKVAALETAAPPEPAPPTTTPPEA